MSKENTFNPKGDRESAVDIADRNKINQAKANLYDELIEILEGVIHCETGLCDACPINDKCDGDPTGMAKKLHAKAKEQ